MPKVLKYRGPGYFDGVPAQDLTDEDVAGLPTPWTADALVKSGLYARLGGGTDALHDAEAERKATVKAATQASTAAEPTRRNG